MFGRRAWIQSALTAVAAFVSGRTLHAQQIAANTANSAERLSERNVVNLEDQLNNGLRTVNSKQRIFVKTVIVYVDHKRIPRAMVNLVYRWATERNPRVPFPYFEFAMRALSKRRGVNLP